MTTPTVSGAVTTTVQNAAGLGRPHRRRAHRPAAARGRRRRGGGRAAGRAALPRAGQAAQRPNARFEVGACSAWLRATAATELPVETVVDADTHAELRYRPVGVVGAIGLWNWPMMITVWQVAPALRMGNTVVVKPSEYTPLSVLALVEVLNGVLPADVLTAVAGARDVGARLSGHPDVDKLMFTGSTATGQAIIRSSADTVKRLTLELSPSAGSSSPATAWSSASRASRPSPSPR